MLHGKSACDKDKVELDSADPCKEKTLVFRPTPKLDNESTLHVMKGKNIFKVCRYHILYDYKLLKRFFFSIYWFLVYRSTEIFYCVLDYSKATSENSHLPRRPS